MSLEHIRLKPEEARQRLKDAIHQPQSKDAPAMWALTDLLENIQADQKQDIKSILDLIPVVDELSTETIWRRIRRRELAILNDYFRFSLLEMPTSSLHHTVFTSSIAQSPDQEAILRAVQSFQKFEEGNDPHGEHDFGAFEVHGERYFFKFDYYKDQNLQEGADPYETIPYHLLTIMRAEEY